MSISENGKIAIGVVITAVVMLGFNFLVRTSSAGIDAEAVKQIEDVIAKEMTLPDKRSFAQAIIDMEKVQAGNTRLLTALSNRASGIAEAETDEGGGG